MRKLNETLNQEKKQGTLNPPKKPVPADRDNILRNQRKPIQENIEPARQGRLDRYHQSYARIGSNLRDLGTSLLNEKEKANLLKQYHSEVLRLPDKVKLPDAPHLGTFKVIPVGKGVSSRGSAIISTIAGCMNENGQVAMIRMNLNTKTGQLDVANKPNVGNSQTGLIEALQDHLNKK